MRLTAEWKVENERERIRLKNVLTSMIFSKNEKVKHIFQ